MLPIERKIDIQIREACFRIAESIIGYESKPDVFEYQYDLEVLFQHADSFYKHTLNEYYLFIETEENIADIIIPALGYIEHEFAIPPMVNDFSWFGDTLHTILTIFVEDDNSRTPQIDNFLNLLALKLKNRINNGKD